MKNLENKPKTRNELEVWMKNNCYNFNGYAINGNFIYEGFGIEQIGGLFNWYFTERGQKDIKKTFKTEQEVIEFAYDQIKNDKWAKSHCIGFLFEERKSEELKSKLTSIGIEYFEDKISYDGPDKTAYRVFVYGCDIKKTENLKLEYFKPTK
ncbi:hypothetical protein [Sinomicrobium sp. M5D2P17]